MINIKFKGHDSGNCRIYGTHNRKLYCIMGGCLQICTQDGEPSHPVSTEYTFHNFTKAQIDNVEVIPGKSHHWDDQVMDLLGIERRTWKI